MNADAQAAAREIRVAAAYEVLLDPDLGRKVDEGRARHIEEADREPFASFEDAQQCAAHIRATPGWTVLDVRGWRPGGPPTTRPHSSRRRLGINGGAAARVTRVPPIVRAQILETGREVNIGSWQRWLTIRPWGER